MSERTITTSKELEKALRVNGFTSSGYAVTDDTAMRVGAVFACVRILSDSVAVLPFHLYEHDGDTRKIQYEHSINKIVSRKPNSWMSSYEFKRLIMTHLCFRGNFYGLIVSSIGRVLEIIPIHPDQMTVSQKENLQLEYKFTGKSGVTKIFAQKDILHIRALSKDGVTGMSPIQAAREEIGLSAQTTRHGGALFKNGAQVGKVLKHPKTLSEGAANRLRSNIEDNYSGADNAHKTLLLEEGLDLDEVGMTSQDSQFIETRKFTRSEIAMFFGVPPHMFGDVEKATSWGTGIEQQGIGFLQFTLMPWLVNIEERFWLDLLTDKESEKLYFKFNVSAVLRGDFKSRQEGLQIQRRNGVISANQWRAVEEMNPREDPGGDEYIVLGISEKDGSNENKDQKTGA